MMVDRNEPLLHRLLGVGWKADNAGKKSYQMGISLKKVLAEILKYIAVSLQTPDKQTLFISRHVRQLGNYNDFVSVPD